MRILIVSATFLSISLFAGGQAVPPEPGTRADHATTSKTIVAPTENAQSQPDAQQIPDHIAYLFFFRHLASLDKVASQQEAIGKDGEGWRSHEQHAIGLSDEEGKILKEVAYHCSDEIKLADAKTQAIAAKLRSGHSPQDLLDAPLPPELTRLRDERIETINAHIAELAAKLGAESFKKLDQYVKNDFKSDIHVVPLGEKPKASVTRPGGI